MPHLGQLSIQHGCHNERRGRVGPAVGVWRASRVGGESLFFFLAYNVNWHWPLQSFISSVQRYEQHAFTAQNTESKRLRQLLEYEEKTYSHLPPDLADGLKTSALVRSGPQQPKPPNASYEALFNLVTAYSLVDKWAEWDALSTRTQARVIPRRLESKHVKNVRADFLKFR